MTQTDTITLSGAALNRAIAGAKGWSDLHMRSAAAGGLADTPKSRWKLVLTQVATRVKMKS